jgi:hypothetical protein
MRPDRALASNALLSDIRAPESTERRTAPTHSKTLLAVILGLIVLARLGFAGLVFASPELALANDTDRYVPIANAILAGNAYAWTTQHPGELLNTVGYPLFLAGVFASLGREPGDVALAQLLATSALAVVVFVLLTRRLGAAAGLAAAVVVAVDPLTILWSMTMLTESLFAVTLGLGTVLVAAWVYSRNQLTLALAGMFFAAACLVKPFALLIIVIWAAGLIVFPGRAGGASRPQLARGIRQSLLFLLPSVLLIAPWFVRNGLLWNCPTLSSVDRVTMRDYMAAKVLAEVEHVELAATQAQLQAADPGVCPSQTAKYWGIILDNPGIYASLHMAGTIPVLIATSFDRWLQYFGTEYTMPDLWRPYMDAGWTGLISVLGNEMHLHSRAFGLLLALTAFQLLLYALAFAGAIAVLRRYPAVDRWYAAMIILSILVLVLSPGQGGHERFRVPVQPLLAILIAYGAARIEAARRQTTPKPTRASRLRLGYNGAEREP